MKALTLAVLAVASLLFASCSTTGPKAALVFKEGVTLQFNYSQTNAANFFRKAYAESTDKLLTRNEIIDDLRGIINQSYREYEVALRSDKNTKDLVATLSSLGLTAAASTTGGEATKSVLSAIATGVIGANATVDKTVFKDQSLEAIRFEMRKLRAEREKLINDGMKKPVTEYTLNHALDDLVEYYNAGFVTRALDSMVLSAGTQAEASQKKAIDAR